MKQLVNNVNVLSKVVLSLSCAFALTGCDLFSNSTSKIQYMPDMADAPTVKAQENYLEPPEHSIPINGVLYPETLDEAEKELKNPYPPSERIIEEGKRVFETRCAVCHGADAKGHNALGEGFPKPPDITTAAYKAKSDAFYFYRITFGFSNMPSYGHAIPADERWKAVHYLRTLQNQ